MAVVQAERAMTILMILYALAVAFGLLACIPMIMHVYPKSECLLFSGPDAPRHGAPAPESFSYGPHESCNFVAYVWGFVIIGGIFLFCRCFTEKRRRHGHAKAGKFEDQQVPTLIVFIHVAVMALTILLTLITTAGYIGACNNLHEPLYRDTVKKLNANPYDTRGEEIRTRQEDDYSFHRYTDRYEGSFGGEFYVPRITCRAILTDPAVYQKLLQSHAAKTSRYYGFWYGQDITHFKPREEAARTNALVEASMAGSWLCLGILLAGFGLMIIQRCVLKKEAKEAERMSVHSTMMGSLHRDGSMAAGYPRNGSALSGSMMRNSNFQRGGSLRGSDRSVKSTRRDIDDIALSMHHMGGSQFLLGNGAGGGGSVAGYGRKDIDDMVLNQHIAQNAVPLQQYPPSHYSSRETGYISAGTPGSSRYNRYQQPPVAMESTILQREEVETEIF